MNFIKVLFYGCAEILRTQIHLFGYSISLMNVLIYGCLVIIVLKFIHEVF